jgi:hypothetical protein
MDPKTERVGSASFCRTRIGNNSENMYFFISFQENFNMLSKYQNHKIFATEEKGKTLLTGIAVNKILKKIALFSKM